jgi:hypothetical protein
MQCCQRRYRLGRGCRPASPSYCPPRLSPKGSPKFETSPTSDRTARGYRAAARLAVPQKVLHEGDPIRSRVHAARRRLLVRIAGSRIKSAETPACIVRVPDRVIGGDRDPPWAVQARHPADSFVFRRLTTLVSLRHCSSMSVFGERMRRVTCVAAPVLLADIGDYRVRVFSLDLKRGDERIFGVHGDVVRLPFQLKPDGKLHRHASSAQYFGPDVRRCPAHV